MEKRSRNTLIIIIIIIKHSTPHSLCSLSTIHWTPPTHWTHGTHGAAVWTIMPHKMKSDAERRVTVNVSVHAQGLTGTNWQQTQCLAWWGGYLERIRKQVSATNVVCFCLYCKPSKHHAQCIAGMDLLCLDWCHTEIQLSHHTSHLLQSKYSDTVLTSPCTDPKMPGTRHSKYLQYLFEAVFKHLTTDSKTVSRSPLPPSLHISLTSQSTHLPHLSLHISPTSVSTSLLPLSLHISLTSQSPHLPYLTVSTSPLPQSPHFPYLTVSTSPLPQSPHLPYLCLHISISLTPQSPHLPYLTVYTSPLPVSTSPLPHSLHISLTPQSPYLPYLTVSTSPLPHSLHILLTSQSPYPPYLTVSTSPLPHSLHILLTSQSPHLPYPSLHISLTSQSTHLPYPTVSTSPLPHSLHISLTSQSPYPPYLSLHILLTSQSPYPPYQPVSTSPLPHSLHILLTSQSPPLPYPTVSLTSVSISSSPHSLHISLTSQSPHLPYLRWCLTTRLSRYSWLCVKNYNTQSIELASKKKEEDKPGSRGRHLASDSGPRGTSGRKPEATQSNGMRTAHRFGMRPIYEFFLFFLLQICFPAEDRIFPSEICSQNSEIRGNEEEFYALNTLPLSYGMAFILSKVSNILLM